MTDKMTQSEIVEAIMSALDNNDRDLAGREWNGASDHTRIYVTEMMRRGHKERGYISVYEDGRIESTIGTGRTEACGLEYRGGQWVVA